MSKFQKRNKIDAQTTIPIRKFGRFNKKHYLCTYENPPSLFTMLKSAGRFISKATTQNIDIKALPIQKNIVTLHQEIKKEIQQWQQQLRQFPR